MKPLSFIIVGNGWRALFFIRIAKQFPDQFRLLNVLCRSEEKAKYMRETYGIPATTSEEECEAAKPDFVVTSLTRDVLYAATKKWALKGFPVLSETPLGVNLEELKDLWKLSQESGARVQVAEQYHRYPIIAAGLHAIEQGKLGDPYAVELSVAHDYHGLSMIRRMLRVQPGPMKLWGRTCKTPVVETNSRDGAITDGSVRVWDRTMITIDFAGGKTAYYDFSSAQYHSYIRARHVNVQGQNGEWNDTMLRYVGEDHLPVQEQLTAYLDPAYAALRTPEVERQSKTWNPFLILDDPQDEYAIASMMYDIRAWIETGKEVYPLAEGLEDAYSWLLIEEAAAHPGQVIESQPMPWHVGK